MKYLKEMWREADMPGKAGIVLLMFTPWGWAILAGAYILGHP